MLFGELDGNLLENFSAISLESSIKCAITINDDKTELLIVSKQASQWFGLELATTEVEGLVDRSEGLKVEVNFLLGFTILHQDDTAEKTKSISGCRSVKLELFFG